MENLYPTPCQPNCYKTPLTKLCHFVSCTLTKGIMTASSVGLLCQQVMAEPLTTRKITEPFPAVETTHYHYDAFSRLTCSILANGINTIYQYGAYGGLTSINHYQGAALNRLITGFTYSYNNAGNTLRRIRSDWAGRKAVEDYGYDAENRLKDYTCSGTLCPRDQNGKIISHQHYTFDIFNNIRTASSDHTTTTYQYDEISPTRLLNYQNSNPDYGNSTTLTYDKNGNITRDDHGNIIVHGPFDQVLSIMDQKDKTVYLYDGNNTQIGEHISDRSPTTYFVYGQGQLLTNIQASKTTSFLYGVTQLGKQDHKGTHYYLTDQNQSVTSITSQTSKQPLVLKNYAYSPYGIESALNRPRAARPVQYFGFDGQLTDRQSHWQFLGHGYRAYNPELHRFMSQDSLSPFDKGGINGYLFGDNNPIMRDDPTGHMSSAAFLSVLTLSGLALLGLGMAIGGQPEAAAALEAPLADSVAATLSATETNSLIVTGFMASNIAPSAYIVYNKAQEHASALNTILSVAVPLVGGFAGAMGMITDSAFLQMFSNASGGASYPIINGDNFDIKKDMSAVMAGLLSGAFSGYVGSYFVRYALAKETSLAAALFTFTARGLAMEANRQSSYFIAKDIMDQHMNPMDQQTIVSQVLVNGPIQFTEGLGMKVAMPYIDANSNSLFSFFLGHVLFNSSGSVVQVGSPLIDHMLDKNS